jgi:hypothetical protein
MNYDVEVLKNMIDNYTMNIEMFSKYNNVEDQLAEMVANRRLIASFIENDGESTVPPKFRNGNVFFDSMLYSAQAGADTSWWTKGT